jgi:hypothetical protein
MMSGSITYYENSFKVPSGMVNNVCVVPVKTGGGGPYNKQCGDARLTATPGTFKYSLYGPPSVLMETHQRPLPTSERKT